MDDLRLRKNFNLGITKDISGKKLSKLEKLQSLVAKCCKIRMKYSHAKLANLYTFVLRVEIGNYNLVAYQFTHVIQKYTNLPTLKGYNFRILQHFATKLCNITNSKTLFLAVVIDFVLLA